MKLWPRLAAKQFQNLEADPSKARILKDVRNTLGKMETNLRHPSLNTHLRFLIRCHFAISIDCY